MAKVGEVLSGPENGWIRIDDTDKNIKYVGDGWTFESYAEWYNSSDHYTCDIGDYCLFHFYGNKIRIIAGYRNDYNKDCIIEIDNKKYNFTLFDDLVKDVTHVLVFEKDDLKNKFHKIKIYKYKDNQIGKLDALKIDAIDLNNDGYMISEEFYNSSCNKLIKTFNKYIGVEEFDLDTSLLDIKNDNNTFSFYEINNKIKNINEDYSIIKIV